MAIERRSVIPLGTGHVGVPRIYAELREQIVAVQLAPGASLSETRLADHFGVSRTPVREAFKRLAEEGLLEIVPQVGSFVAKIHLRTVHDNLFVREALECRIVELAAGRIDTAARRRLAASLATQARAMAARDGPAFFRADEGMHELLAEIAGHASAWQVIHAAKAQMDRVRRLSLVDHARSRTRMREHREIVGCVVDGDAAGAMQAMRTHLGSIFDAITNIAQEHAHYFVGLEADR